ncbi:MAG: hypothetical protein V7754_20780 [Halioglobus sp.]
MSATALARYLHRHIEPDLPEAPAGSKPWQHVLVIPAYNESPLLLEKLTSNLASAERTLCILVLNRPESEPNPHCNQALRESVHQRSDTQENNPPLVALTDTVDLFLLDLEMQRGPTPDSQGVGLARKTGCDLALYWQSLGHIHSEWICSSDADAELPRDYFRRLALTPDKTVAAVFPFMHVAGADVQTDEATALYELWLHYYVLGLSYASSPYAYHTLGSCIAIRRDCYAQVRGYPKRAGGEDFYLLNKAAKTGPVARLEGECIALESRISTRVPFGTGPAVAKIMVGGDWEEQAMFYHPDSFEALRIWLNAMPGLFSTELDELPQRLEEQGLSQPLAQDSYQALMQLGVREALAHCRRQGKSQAQFERQFHQWFDGFRTLKFLHSLRQAGWKDQSLKALSATQPDLWPVSPHQQQNIYSLRAALCEHWGWTNQEPPHY